MRIIKLKNVLLEGQNSITYETGLARTSFYIPDNTVITIYEDFDEPEKFTVLSIDGTEYKLAEPYDKIARMLEEEYKQNSFGLN